MVDPEDDISHRQLLRRLGLRNGLLFGLALALGAWAPQAVGLGAAHVRGIFAPLLLIGISAAANTAGSSSGSTTTGGNGFEVTINDGPRPSPSPDEGIRYRTHVSGPIAPVNRQITHRQKDASRDRDDGTNAGDVFSDWTFGLGSAWTWIDDQVIGWDAMAAHEHALLEAATDALKDIPGLRIQGTAPGKAKDARPSQGRRH